jgi:predicted CDP-diglyceride synthetase/phosphatidate cytidylyltransferase
MTLAQKFYWLIGGIVVLLMVATAVGRILRARVHDEAAAAVDNLNARCAPGGGWSGSLPWR